MLAVAEGKDPAAEKKADRDAGTFSDLAAKYVNSMPKNITNRGRKLTRWCGVMRYRAGARCKPVALHAPTLDR
jgi:hypothetical protein